MSGLGLRSPAFVGILNATSSPTVPSAPVLTGGFYSYDAESGISLFNLSWTTPANGGSAITGYSLQYSFNGSTFFLQEALASNVTTYQIGVSGTNYFRVFATNAIGNSPVSNVYTAVG